MSMSVFLILSSDGNVGKTTLARFCLRPFLTGARLVDVEEVAVTDGNAKPTLVIRDAGDTGRPVLAAVLRANIAGTLIVDVGASLYGAVIDLLADARTSLMHTPLVILTPVVIGIDPRKALAHLGNVAAALDALALPALRRVLVANRVQASESAVAAYQHLAQWAVEHRYTLCRTLLPDASVFARGATEGYDLAKLAATDTAKLEAAAAMYLDAGDFVKMTEVGRELTAVLDAQRIAPVVAALAAEIFAAADKKENANGR